MNSPTGSWDVQVKKPAQKNLRRAPRPERERLLAALTAMRDDPFAGDVARLKQQPTAFRRRVGNWRILFDADPRRLTVDVRFIERRSTTIYRKRHA